MGSLLGREESSKNKGKPRNDNPITLQWKELQREDKELFGDQWASLFGAALSGENIEKNRYQSVLAPDSSRVKLNTDGLGTDYINANFIDGIHKNSKNAYIAAQAPTPETIDDFWRMCWEQNIYVVVMLTNLEEGGRVKAHQYWPKAGSKQYGQWSVTFLSSNTSEDEAYVIRKFEIRKGTAGGLKAAKNASSEFTGKEKQEKRIIVQYHYQIWPDMGVPQDASSLLDMMVHVDQELQRKPCNNNNNNIPLLVHCSAGIGRTGTYVVIDTVIKKLREDNSPRNVENLDLQPILSNMRNQRPGLVQQKAQYLFCYKAIKYAITGEIDEPASQEVEQASKKKKEEDEKEQPRKN